MPSEFFDKMTAGGKSRSKSNLGNIQISRKKQVLGGTDPYHKQVFIEVFPHDPTEELGIIAVAQIHLLRRLGLVDIGIMPFNIFQ